MTRPLPSLRASAIANYVGQGWSALISIAFLPLYIGVLGLESYALIGVFALLQAWMSVLDLGLTPTLNREMARLRAGAHTGESIRDLLRSLEIICGGIAAMAAVGLWIAAPWLASEWLHVQGMAVSTATDAVRIMCFVLAFRFFELIYRGALQGAHDQIWLNVTSALLATLRWGGAYIVITRVAPTVSAFFLWQGAVSILTTAILIHRTYFILPEAHRRGRFERSALREIYGFARGMFLGSLLAFVLTQSDKLAVSSLLPLGELGYYTLAAALAGALMQLVVPLNTAVYPRLTGQVAEHREADLRETYHAACEWMAAIVVPPALVLAFFPELVLLAWSGNPATAAQVAPLLRILVLGQLANAFMNLPYMLQLAYGWTSLSIRINSAAVIVFVPAVMLAVPRFGAIGAAWVWLGLNLGYLAIVAAVMHRRLLLGAMPRWYRGAVAYPLGAGATAGVILLLAMPEHMSRGTAALAVVGAGALIFVSTGIAIPATRGWAWSAVAGGKSRGSRTCRQ